MSIIKTFFANIQSVFHKKEGHEAWNNTIYVLILEHKKYNFPTWYGDEPFYACAEFHTKEEALKYLDENVSKSDRKHCHLYKEIKL